MATFLTAYYAPLASTIALGLAVAAWKRATWNQARLGRLTTRVNTLDTFADNESVRVETRLSALENAVGNETFAGRSAREALWEAIKFLKREADGAGCSGKAAPEAAKGWNVGHLVETRGGNGVEFVAGEAGSN